MPCVNRSSKRTHGAATSAPLQPLQDGKGMDNHEDASKQAVWASIHTWKPSGYRRAAIVCDILGMACVVFVRFMDIYECVCTQIPTLSHTHSYSLILMHSYTHKHTHTHTHTVDARTERTMRRMARASLAKMGTMFHSNKFETGLLTIASRSHVIWNALMLLLEPGECVCGCVCDVLQLIGIDTR
jgi:hypothetical protein